jgi:predicted nucleotide-binding protein (sugar kinase/HSP70/actin superfamily)
MTKLEEAMYKEHRKSEEKKDTKKYHDWVYMADDQINHVLKYVIILVFACGGIAIISDLIKRFV